MNIFLVINQNHQTTHKQMEGLLLPGQAWAEQEGNLHRGLMQYAIRRAIRNPRLEDWLTQFMISL